MDPTDSWGNWCQFVFPEVSGKLVPTLFPHYWSQKNELTPIFHPFFQAATTLFFFGVNGALAEFHGDAQALTRANASIVCNTPYAQPFSSLLVLAGEIAEFNRLQEEVADRGRTLLIASFLDCGFSFRISDFGFMMAA
jgi:hypothetical protein